MKAEIQPRARKNEQIVITTLQKITGNTVAERMEVSPTTVSRFKNGELTEWCLFLAALGLKCVPENFKCMDPDKNQALLTLAKAYLKAVEHPNQMVEDDPE